jgi:hypothetical protein
VAALPYPERESHRRRKQGPEQEITGDTWPHVSAAIVIFHPIDDWTGLALYRPRSYVQKQNLHSQGDIRGTSESALAMSVLMFPPGYYYIDTLPLESAFQASL